MGVYLLLASSSITEGVILLFWKKMVGSSILWPWSMLTLYWSGGILFSSHALLLHAGINLLLHFLLVCLDLRLYLGNSLLSFILFKLEQSLLFDSVQMLSLDLFNLLFVVFMEIFHLLDILRNVYFLAIDSVLMSLVEISFFSQLFPGRLCLICNHVCLFKLHFHCLDF